MADLTYNYLTYFRSAYLLHKFAQKNNFIKTYFLFNQTLYFNYPTLTTMNSQYYGLTTFQDEPSDLVANGPVYTNLNSFDNISPEDGSQGSPYHDTDSISDKSKKIRKKRNTYQKIDDETRIKLLDAVQQGETLKAAAKRYGINYSSAKSILHTYRKEGRILKKSAQERTTRKRTKLSSDMEMSPIYLSSQYQDEFNFQPSSYNNQIYYTSEAPRKSEFSFNYNFQNQENVKPNMSGMTINSFGDFLKVDSQPQQKPENLNSKSPSSTIVLNLASQGFQQSPNTETKVPQGRNWQLNVNVHSEGAEKVRRTLNFGEEHRDEKSQMFVGAPEKVQNFENIYMNYSSSPIMPQGNNRLQRREDYSNYNPQYIPNRQNTYHNMIPTGQEEFQNRNEVQGNDVSYFLNSSSPTHAFSQKLVEMDHPIGNFENYSTMENYRGYLEPQELKKSPYIGNVTAGLRGY